MEEKQAQYQKEWQERNRERLTEYRKEWRRKKAEQDPEWFKKTKENNLARIRALRENPEYVEKDRKRASRYYYEKGKSKRTPESRFKDKLRQKYGLTLERFEELLEATKGRCPICREPINRRTAHIDHCHATGIVRGLLCQRCNQAEGFLRTPEIALRMYEYMKKNELFYNGNGGA